ncbi:thioredoxin 1 [Microdochium nivale]|nr:thioredoxin 1 [Microdochium nivale]
MLSLPSVITTTSSRFARTAAQRVFHRLSSSPSYTTRFATPYRGFHATTRNMTVHNIESVEAWKEALENNKIVMLDCFAVWCGPCKAIAPILAKHSNDEQFKDIFFAKIDVDQLPDVSKELNIRAMPTFKIFIDGKEADELVGANPNALQTLLVNAVKPTV